MKAINELTQKFRDFPGIGQRQAQRFVYFLLRRNPSYTQELIDLLQKLHQNIRLCTESYQYFYVENPLESRSPIARDPSRDRSMIMVVEKDTDIDSIEKSHAYHGTYFVLGGLLPAIASKRSSGVREQELLDQVIKRADEEMLTEIIFGLSLNTESENTRASLTRSLKPLQEKYGFKISRLGRGLSTGTEVEYSDGDTLASALSTRINE